MAVDMSDLSGILKNVDLKSILGGNMSTDSTGLGGGVLGAVLIGALLPRLLGNENGVAATAATPVLTAADVQNIVNGNTNTQTLGTVKSEIWQAEGQVQAAIAAASSTSTITNLQGQIALLSAVDSSGDLVSKDVGLVGAAVASGNAATLANLNQLNTNLLQGNYNTLAAITTDGDKTRALIQSIETANLNTQIIVARNELAEARHRDTVTASGVNVTNNINQTAVANANATVQQQIVGLLGTLASSLQHNTQSVVNLGNMVASPLTATNVRT